MNDARRHRAPVGALAAGRILLTWRRLELRRLAVDLARQPVAAATVVLLLAATIPALRGAFQHEPQSEISRFAIELSACCLAFWLLARLVAAAQARGPLQTVFFPLVVGLRRRVAYRLVETTVIWLALLGCAIAALLSLAPDRTAGFFAAAGAGLPLAAAVTWLRSQALDHSVGALAGPDMRMRSLQGHLLVARSQWRHRIGPAPAWVVGAGIASTTLFAAALACRNNSDPGVGESILLGGASLTGALSGRIDPNLVRFIGREPLSLVRIIAAAALPTPGVVAFATGLAALALGLGLTVAIGIGAGVGALLAFYMSAVVLHALSGRPRFASFAAGVDLAICAAFLVTYAPLAWFWGPLRGLVLVRQARGRRWLDR